MYLHPFSKISVYVIKKRQGVRSLNKYTFESKFMYCTVYKIVSDPVDSGLKDPDTTLNWYTLYSIQVFLKNNKGFTGNLSILLLEIFLSSQKSVFIVKMN